MHKLLPGLGRATATLLVVLWTVQPVALWAHAGEHTHHYCAAHRTFEEGQQRPSAAGASAVKRAAWDEAAAAVLHAARPPATEASGLRAHEACGMPTCGNREPALIGDLLTLRARAAVMRPALPAPLHPPAPPLAVLDTAPKGSPPARA